MKATRIFLLGFVAAIFAMALTFEHAAAQCWTCTGGFMLVDDDWKWCGVCTGGDEGAKNCGMSSCNGCWALGPCSVQLSLDGRSAAPEVPEPPSFDQPGGAAAFVATFASADRGPVPPSNARQTRRSCDGGIISKWYSVSAVRAARGATAQLRL
ncbi:hypothetical protein [Candidatus Palauibacter sp.]|uniref:hypothetical protein n=1 Tax=Candidatus Palauibacter sp. TaxID=3101350 RepID=UPI003AF29B9D